MKPSNILIVEDDPDWRNLLMGYLSDDYAVMAASDYSSAAAVLREQVFDLVVLDLRLDDDAEDDFQGMEVLTLLRSLEGGKAARTGAVIISAYGTNEQIRNAYLSLALCDFIPKQEFEKEEYRAVVKKTLKRVRNAALT